MEKAIQFLKAHKREATGLVAGVIGYLAYTGHSGAALNLGYVATFLAGAGFLESDAFHKGQ